MDGFERKFPLTSIDMDDDWGYPIYGNSNMGTSSIYINPLLLKCELGKYGGKPSV